MVSDTRALPKQVVIEVEGGSRVAAPFTHEEISPPSSAWDLGLETGIWASRLGFEPRSWDLSLAAGI